MLDEQILEEATRELGLKTYSATVNYALQEALRMRKVELAEFHGSNLGSGNLTKMRADRTARLARGRR